MAFISILCKKRSKVAPASQGQIKVISSPIGTEAFGPFQSLNAVEYWH